MIKTQSTNIPSRYLRLTDAMFIAAFGIFGCISIAASDPSYVLRFLQLVFFALSGLLYSVLWDKKPAGFMLLLKGDKLGNAFALSLIASAILFPLYFFSENGESVLAMASSASFLFPVFLIESWKSFYNVSAGETGIWLIGKPVDKHFYKGFVANRHLSFRTNLQEGGSIHFAAPVKVPVKLKLGLLFQKFLEEQEDNVPMEGSSWLFYQELLGGLRQKKLDPEKNLIDNGIRDNAVITAKMIKYEIDITK